MSLECTKDHFWRCFTIFNKKVSFGRPYRLSKIIMDTINFKYQRIDQWLGFCIFLVCYVAAPCENTSIGKIRPFEKFSCARETSIINTLIRDLDFLFFGMLFSNLVYYELFKFETHFLTKIHQDGSFRY